jgi:hypothetical protein
MRTAFVAIWYDRNKVIARAKERGWDGDDGMLDVYHPEEDSKGHEAREFPDLAAAEKHLRTVIASGNEFWGQAKVREIEVGGPRCRHCDCRGFKCVREHIVEAEGIVDVRSYDECG